MELNMPRPGGNEAEGDDADTCEIGIDKVKDAGRDVEPPLIITEDDLLPVTWVFLCYKKKKLDISYTSQSLLMSLHAITGAIKAVP